MYPVPKDTAAFKGNLRYVDTCPNSPMYGKAFCEDHCAAACTQGIPTDLKSYLSYKGMTQGYVDCVMQAGLIFVYYTQVRSEPVQLK